MGRVAADEFVRHRGPVTCVAGIPNTQSAVTSGYDGAVGLFEIDSGKVELLGYHDHLVNRVVVNKAGTRAASSSSDYTVYIWDLKTRQVEQVLRGHSDDAEDFVFVNDSVGASVSRDWRILVWNLQTGSILRVIEGHEKDVLAIDYYEGKLFTSGDDMTLRVWDLDSGKLIRMWGPFETETDTCALDPVHGRAILGCDDGIIRVFDIYSGNNVGEIKAHSSGIKKVAVSPISGDILSAAYDQRIILWNASDLTHRLSLEGVPSLWERSFNWSPDGTRILAGTFDGTVLVWDSRDGKCLAEVGSQRASKGNPCFNDVAANALGEVALVSDDGYIRRGILNSSTSEWLSTTEPSSGRMLMNAVTADDTYNLVVAGAHNQRLQIYSKRGPNLDDEREVVIGEGPINSIRISHHNGYEGMSFVGCYSGAIVMVTRHGEVAGKFRVHENAVKALRLHPHNPIGVSCSADGILVSWDFSGNLLHQYLGHLAIIDDVDIDPTGQYIASAGRDFTLKVYSIDEGRLLHNIHLGRRSPKAVCFVNDETVIITNYWGELIRVSLSDGHVLRRDIADNGISSVARSGSHIIAVSYDGCAYLVDPDGLTILNELRAMVQRVEGFMHA